MAGNTTNLSIRMDADLKAQADALFTELGMNLTTAFNVFVRQSLRLGKIPFEVADPFYSDRNMARLRDSILKAEAGKLKKHALIEA